MGYYVNAVDCDIHIPHDKLGEAYRLMCELNKRDDLKRGGTWQEGKRAERWFSWMDPNYPETCANAQEILEALGFEVETNEDGDIVNLRYDSKIGQEELFLTVISPCVRDGSFIDWLGEDGERWRYSFDNGEMHSWEAVVSYRKIEEEA